MSRPDELVNVAGDAIPTDDPRLAGLDPDLQPFWDWADAEQTAITEVPDDRREAYRAFVAERVRAEGERRMDAVVRPYRPAERETWPEQVKEAEAWTADNAASVPLLTAMAAGRGWTVADLVARINAKRTAYKTAVGAVLGRQQALEDAVTAAGTVATLRAIDVTAGWPE